MSEPATQKTEGSCPICGGNIVCVKYLVPNRPPELMIMGPGGEDNYREKQSFHCEKCGVLFAFPTPKPISDMMKKHMEMNAANTRLLGAMLGVKD